MNQANLDTARLRERRRLMLRIRAFEEAAIRAADNKLVLGAIHPSVGQEAVAAGVCAPLRKDDLLLSTHRGHGHTLAKGADARAMMRELFGREGGNCGGKGGSMHLVDLNSGFFAAVPIVGSTIPIAVGVAWAFKLKKSSNIVTVFLGDGATEEGVFFESLDFASLKNVPILFVCENNLYSVYSQLDVRQAPGRKLSALAESHGIKSFTGDGNNIDQVSELSKEAIEYIKSNNAPAFMELDTFRWLEHCGPNDDDDLGYRKKGELDYWITRDPISSYKARMIKTHQLTDQQIIKKTEVISTEIDEAFKFAKESPFPDQSVLNQHIYKD
ncbi:MAG: thiamine pyrophosphate-dependent dehydrogenase E1 component subunit alpha [Alphaproteobacteria bacterium]|nr:thiamine pyrophosphate-dependent dehydrogenase E1 component subunit alpha [Alphaproteobacteria bacterium]